MVIDLSKQVILVTGAARGIGEAISRQLLASGAKVALHYNNSSQSVQKIMAEYPQNARALQANLANTEDCKKLFEEVLQQFGTVDCIVNNAGIALHSPINQPDWPADWDLTMQVNLKAAAILDNLALQHWLKNQKQGRLIHISSRAAFRGDTADYMAYAASKAGMVALSHSIARAYGKQGIRSFVIAPGFTQTDMAQDFIDEYGEDYVLKDIALEKITQSQDLAPIVCFLASGLADHATASTFTFNAGSYVH
jgi:NAD(P)-dependent dehydrogenase (short-subunit alcohol dehydrogenase family)